MQKGLKLAVSAMALTFALGVAGEAMATEGMFQHAYGLRHKALAGAGVASAEDATAISLNPAGLVDVGNQFNMGVSFFMPFREYKGIGTGFVNPGKHKSKRNFFPAPTLAYSRQLDADSAIAFSIFGNGGMNTTWKASTNTSAGCNAPPPFGPGGGVNPYCGSGKAGVDLMQMFISGAYARRFGDGFSIGIAPIFAVQRFKAFGLQAFDNATYSAHPGFLTNNGYNWSVGGGVRVGVMFKPTDRFSFGASYQTKMWMTKLKKYRGLFENGGQFDMAANLQVGIAYQMTDDLKVMLDYRHIFYSDLGAVGNSSLLPAQFGSKGGPGFGWRDTNTIKVGLEYQASDNLILRAGYAYVFPNPVRKRDVMINILAPGVIRHEITGGGTYRYNANNDIDFAFMFAPKGKQKGAVPAAFGGGTVKLGMSQFEASIGWTYNFDGSRRAR